ncbi:MAG TPA: AI-2E family transporter, partial [Sorangium sp.]|nr:AI-2E family transporter [Sorangium sp.]
MASRPTPFRYARQLFFAISALTLLAIVLLARPVLLPFLLAMVVAYVLFPAVTRLQRWRLPRWVAILLVYALTIGAMVGLSVAVVPRLFAETKNLSAELPRLTRRFRDDWLPKIDAQLRRIVPASPAAEAGAAPSPSAAGSATSDNPAPQSRAPIVITPRADGAYEVRLRDDLEFRRNPDHSWTLRSPEVKPSQGFSSEQALRDAFDKTIAYAQKNSLELIDAGRKVVGRVSRGVFYFFLTLMLAGYMMLTYESIYAFLREMWPEHRRASFDRFVKRVDRGLGGVVRGQLLICLVNGGLSAIGFWIFGLK